MAVNVKKPNHQVDKFEEADRVEVQDGHLMVTKARGGRILTVAIFAPSMWVSAHLDPETAKAG